MPGIYRIINKVTRKMYIGKTKQEFSKRWYMHKYTLNKGTSNCVVLQRAWNKYGSENFILEPLVQGLFSPIELKQWEEIYIKLYGNYNIQKVSNINTNYKNLSKKLSSSLKKAWKEGRRTGTKWHPAWELYEEIKLFWLNKTNGRGGKNHPGHVKVANKFNTPIGITKIIISKIKTECAH